MRIIDQEEANRITDRHMDSFMTDGDLEGRAHFLDASLTSIKFERSLTKATFHRCRLEGVNFNGCNLQEAAFDECTLNRCDLSYLPADRLYAERSLFSNCSFTGSSLSRAHLKAARLEFCDLSEATLRNVFAVGASFRGSILKKVEFDSAWLDSADFSGAVFAETNFRRSHLGNARLSGLNLETVNFAEVDLRNADLSTSQLQGADFSGSDLRRAKFVGSRLEAANLSHTIICAADLSRANLLGANIYGSSVWDVRLDDAVQSNLNISAPGEPPIMVDDLETAQFVYLILKHKKLRNVINAVTQRGVLLLGAFRDGGKQHLEAIAGRLRQERYLPIIFDFDRPDNRNLTETVKTLAGLCRFVIADVGGPSVPQELYATVPHFKIPFVPIHCQQLRPYAMLADLIDYPWVLKPTAYESTANFVDRHLDAIIAQVEERLKERQARLKELFGT